MAKNNGYGLRSFLCDLSLGLFCYQAGVLVGGALYRARRKPHHGKDRPDHIKEVIDTDGTISVGREKNDVWEAMPDRIIIMRHAESQGNVDRTIYERVADSQISITERGVKQAKAAGVQLAKLIGDEGIDVVLSPFLRAQQTFRAVASQLRQDAIKRVHFDPRVREKEFGNLQKVGSADEEGSISWHGRREAAIGRFYYRRPGGESAADVFDRVGSFWESLLHNGSIVLSERFLSSSTLKSRNLLIVTHGLTMRLLLMSYFNWNVDTFESGLLQISS